MKELWTRFVYSADELPARIDGVELCDGRPLGGFWLSRVIGVPAAFAPGGPVELAGGTVLPSLNTPAAKLPAPVLTWLAARGVTPGPEDTLLNLLRALRAARGGDSAFDISNPF